jgi:hypothetical protein
MGIGEGGMCIGVSQAQKREEIHFKGNPIIHNVGEQVVVSKEKGEGNGLVGLASIKSQSRY